MFPQKTVNSNNNRAFISEDQNKSDCGISKIDLTKRNLFIMKFSLYRTKYKFIETRREETVNENLKCSTRNGYQY